MPTILRRPFIGALLAIVAIGVAILGVGPGASKAHAAGTACPRYKFASSKLDMQVENASFQAGARITQMYPVPVATEYGWCTTTVGDGVVLIYNEHSNLCLTTDGVAGHWLTQEYCNRRAGQLWVFDSRGVTLGLPSYQIRNYVYGLVLDVYGDSRSNGAVIDAWYPNNGANQLALQVNL